MNTRVAIPIRHHTRLNAFRVMSFPKMAVNPKSRVAMCIETRPGNDGDDVLLVFTGQYVHYDLALKDQVTINLATSSPLVLYPMEVA